MHQEIKTIDQLCKYLEDEYYNFDDISIGQHHAPEGIIIEKDGDSYNYCFSERGHKEIEESFETEADLVEYALEELLEDDWNRAHLVAWVWNEKAILKAEKELREKNIEFKRNDIPNFSKGKDAYRIFVFGKDVLKADFLKKKYWKVNI